MNNPEDSKGSQFYLKNKILANISVRKYQLHKLNQCGLLRHDILSVLKKDYQFSSHFSL